MYIQNCSICSNEFESSRPASYCSATCRKKASRDSDIFHQLDQIRNRYKDKVTPEILTRETGIDYSFVPSWIHNGLSLEDIGK